MFKKMKVLFYRYGSICEPDILEVFTKLNIEIYEDTMEMQEKHAMPSARVKHFAESYQKASEAGKPDFIFSLNFFPYVSEFCEKLNILYVCWSVDCPVLELFSKSIRNKCNRIFLFDEIQYQEIHFYNPEGVFYLPLATSVERWDRELTKLSKKDQKEYSTDISFVGSLYHEKSPLSMLEKRLPLPEYLQGYIKGVVKAQLLIYGSNFLQEMVTPELIRSLKKTYPDFYSLKSGVTDTDAYVAANYYLGMLVSEMERIEILNTLAQEQRVTVYTRSNTSLLQNVDYRGGITTHVQMPRVFRLSKINLNITMKGIQSGLPLRIWDVLGCCGFLLTNYQAEIPSYFEMDKDLVCYESVEDCVEKARYYLEHDDIRMEIANSGYRKVKAMHTYEHRIIAILKELYPEV